MITPLFLNGIKRLTGDDKERDCGTRKRMQSITMKASGGAMSMSTIKQIGDTLQVDETLIMVIRPRAKPTLLALSDQL